METPSEASMETSRRVLATADVFVLCAHTLLRHMPSKANFRRKNRFGKSRQGGEVM